MNRLDRLQNPIAVALGLAVAMAMLVWLLRPQLPGAASVAHSETTDPIPMYQQYRIY